MKRGYWNYGMMPYGYAYDKDRQLLSPQPVEVAIIHRMFESAASLMSLTELANMLSEEGLRTRIRAQRSRDGNTRGKI